jgi:DNA-binding response OmpR family regulator
VIPVAEFADAKILIVDDNALNVTLMERMLARAGYSCVSSTLDPMAVLDLYRRNRYDLIILDLQMPCFDGFQVMKSLGETENHAELFILVTSAEPGHKIRAMEEGARDFVSKPFQLSDLMARVAALLRARPKAGPASLLAAGV